MLSRDFGGGGGGGGGGSSRSCSSSSSSSSRIIVNFLFKMRIGKEAVTEYEEDGSGSSSVQINSDYSLYLF